MPVQCNARRSADARVATSSCAATSIAALASACAQERGAHERQHTQTHAASTSVRSFALLRRARGCARACCFF